MISSLYWQELTPLHSLTKTERSTLTMVASTGFSAVTGPPLADNWTVDDLKEHVKSVDQSLSCV